MPSFLTGEAVCIIVLNGGTFFIYENSPKGILLSNKFLPKAGEDCSIRSFKKQLLMARVSGMVLGAEGEGALM